MSMFIVFRNLQFTKSKALSGEQNDPQCKYFGAHLEGPLKWGVHQTDTLFYKTRLK